MKVMMTIARMFWWLVVVLCAILIVWMAISYADVVAHNLTEGYEYPKWNLLTMFIE